MTYELILPLMMFALVSSITPGPNNLMLLASGANFGFRRTLPHMLGISLGFAFMVFLVGLGLAQVFELYPVLKLALKVLAVAYMVYLAWKIANAAAPKAAAEAGKPFTFLQAAAFQWVNPKAWAMALTAVTIYAPSQEFTVIAVVAAVFAAVNLPSVTLWAVLGQQAQRILTNQRRLRVFNVTMALLLVASLYSVLVF
ncbi:MAG: LysE family translocator [Amylibacter sp.]|nr:LysE family translocator [Amylibacter sp.]